MFGAHVCGQLKDLVTGAAAHAVRNEASDEQKERVRALERADRARRRDAKSKQSAKKSSRSSKGWD
jgi:peptidyl-tRNA hydrolase ICT1